jgi:hypothetical protein
VSTGCKCRRRTRRQRAMVTPWSLTRNPGMSFCLVGLILLASTIRGDGMEPIGREFNPSRARQFETFIRWPITRDLNRSSSLEASKAGADIAMICGSLKMANGHHSCSRGLPELAAEPD